MSKDNGKPSGTPRGQKPVPVNIAVHATIMQLHAQQKIAKSRLDLALMLLKQQLGVKDAWEYDTGLRAFTPPTQPVKAAQPTSTRSQEPRLPEGDRPGV